MKETIIQCKTTEQAYNLYFAYAAFRQAAYRHMISFKTLSDEYNAAFDIWMHYRSVCDSYTSQVDRLRKGKRYARTN